MEVINQRSVRVTRSNHRIKKQQSTNMIHTTIHSSDRTPFKNHNNFFSFSKISVTGYHRNLVEKESNRLNKNSTCVSTSQNRLATKSTANISSHSKNINNQIQVEKHVVINQLHTIKNVWADQKDVTIDHHSDAKSKKKKKKFLRLCIFISIYVALLLCITIITILIVFLAKPKTNPVNVTIRWNSTGVTIAGITGEYGTTSDRLHTPFGLASDFNNTLYIADYQNNRVQMYLPSASTGKTVAGFSNGTQVSNANGFRYCTDVVVNSDGNLYIVDMGNSRVQFWLKGASNGITVAGSGGLGTLSNQLMLPYSVARDSNSGALYIADSMNYRIMVYASNASTGSLFAGYQGPGTNRTQLNFVSGLYLDSPSNSLIIANTYASNIIRWQLNANYWTLVAGNINGSYGSTSTSLFYPYDVTLDPMGNIYVADTINQRIQFFPIGQSDGVTIAGMTGVAGNSSTLLNSPYSLVLDNQLNLYVSDSNNHRVQKFFRY